MKMKTKITAICTLALALLLSGCAADNGMTPTPTVRPTLSADPTLTVTPDDTTGPDASASPGGDMGGDMGGAGGLTIEGFKEGDSIDPKQLPEAITNSIKEKYPEGVIKSAAYSTYENQQMYKLILQNVGNSDSTECYVKPDGTIVPATAAEGGGTANG